MFKQILKKISTYNADVDDAIDYFQSNQLYSRVALLYKALGNVENSLDTWLKLASKDLTCDSGDEFDAVGIMVDVLVE